MSQVIDEQMMSRAIAAARQGDPSPNPHVGCVIALPDGVQGTVVAETFHQAAGEKHAEILALEAAGPLARGATVYVTLEPCNHHGRTPPCVDALIRAEVARVVVGCRDPNPNVLGQGIERLQAAGIEVTIGVKEYEAQDLIAPWAKFITTGSSFLSLKLALSLDGRIASRTGRSKWITGPESRAHGHALRARHDAVMVGVNTVIADDPRLTVRAVSGKSPARVVIDSKLRIPEGARLVTSAREISTCIMTTTRADAQRVALLESLGVSVVRVPSTAEGRCDMRAVLRELAKREVVSVLCEGGAELAGTLLAGKQVERLYAFIAPLLLGPRGRPGAVDWAGPEGPSDAPRLVNPEWELHGRDAFVSGRIEYPSMDDPELA